MRDLVITWPKTRTLFSYLGELANAKARGEVINYRVPRQPTLDTGSRRCFVVHDGAVRGWSEILDITYREAGEVTDPVSGGAMRAGWYIVREPVWVPLAKPLPMPGFRGFRYFDRRRVEILG